MMATAYTGKYPDAVDGLIVCEPGGLKWDDVVEYVVNSQDFSFWGEILNDAFFLDQFLTGEENDHEILDYKFGLLAAENTITDETTYAPGSFWRQGAVVNSTLFQLAQENNPDFSTGIENYTKPVLFIYSELNLVYTDAWAEKISSVYPSVELHKIPGVGHDMISLEEGWNITFPIMIEYFDSL
ncbi:MAG: alpha/beta hydrolase, partial [Chitinophagales bacterium]